MSRRRPEKHKRRPKKVKRFRTLSPSRPAAVLPAPKAAAARKAKAELLPPVPPAGTAGAPESGS